MARHRRHVQPADLPGFLQTPLTRRTVTPAPVRPSPQSELAGCSVH